MPDPLLPPVVALLAGVVAARYVGFGAGELATVIGALAVLALVALAKSTRRMACAATLAALFFAGAFVGVAHLSGPAPELDAGAREVVILGGCVVEPIALSEDREQFVLELEPGARARVSLYAREGETLPHLRYGQRVEVAGRVRRVRNFGNPGAFDYERYMARESVYWTASARADTVKILPGGCGSRFGGAVMALRTAILERIESLYSGRRYETAMMGGLLIGQSEAIEKAWTEDFRRTGTYHALVVSGMHLTVLAAVILFLMRVCWVPAGIALAVTTAGAWVYAFVCGGDAPVVRAAAGCTLYTLARFFYRRTHLLNLLAGAVLGFILLDPEQVFDASFQLSFLSVAVLGALAVPLLERTSAPCARGLRLLSDRGLDLHLEPRLSHFRLELRLAAETLRLVTHVPDKLWLVAMQIALGAAFYAFELAVISVAVQFGLALPMAVYFHRLAITGITANLIVVPATSIAIVVGFAAVASGWHFLAVCAAWLLWLARVATEWHVQWEIIRRIPDPPFWLAALFVACVAALAFVRRLPVLAVSAGLLGIIVWHPFRPEIAPGELELTAIDVGQAESLFVALPSGKLLLVDTGGIAAQGQARKPRLDIGEDVVSPYLWTRSVRRLDAVAITHFHDDHAGGLPAVLANFRPEELWVAAGGGTRVAGIRTRSLKPGDDFDYGGARVHVLSGGASEPADNNDSLVLSLTHGQHTFLLTGDIERPVESELVAHGLVPRSVVLKAPHHGSRTSNTEPFLDAVHPALGIISAGFENSFGNPHPIVVRRLEQRGARVLDTAQWGLVSVASDGRRLRLDTNRWRDTTHFVRGSATGNTR